MTGWLAIVNPRSGGARDRPAFGRVVDGLERVVRKIVFTEGPGHAAELAARASGYAGLAAVGGDGTVHEILGGNVRRALRVAVVPTGRGNSLARDLGLTSALAGIAAIEAQSAARIDLLDVVLEQTGGRRRFCRSASTVAVGYPVAATARADRSFRGAGSFCYLAAAIVEAAHPRRFAIEVSYDGVRAQGRTLTGFIANNTRHLANFVGFPDARCDDGRFDVMELDAGFLRQSAHNVAALCGSRWAAPPSSSATALDASLAEPASVMVDGQIYTSVTAIHVRIAPGALQCFRARDGGASR